MTVNIHLPEDLEDELRRRIDGTEFESVDEYVLFVLREVTTDDGYHGDESSDQDTNVERRLENLGYL